MPFPNPATQIKPGEKRNPEGRNQYTYRREYENGLKRILQNGLNDEQLEALGIPEEFRSMLPERPTMQDVIALQTTVRAAMGDKVQLPEANARLWPKVERHELTGADGNPLLPAAPQLDDTDASLREAAHALEESGLAPRPKGNGKANGNGSGRLQ